MPVKTMFAPWQDDLIRQKYPEEGASIELANALGIHPHQLRARAHRLEVRCSAATKKRKAVLYNCRGPFKSRFKP